MSRVATLLIVFGFCLNGCRSELNRARDLPVFPGANRSHFYDGMSSAARLDDDLPLTIDVVRNIRRSHKTGSVDWETYFIAATVPFSEITGYYTAELDAHGFVPDTSAQSWITRPLLQLETRVSAWVRDDPERRLGRTVVVLAYVMPPTYIHPDDVFLRLDTFGVVRPPRPVRRVFKENQATTFVLLLGRVGEDLSTIPPETAASRAREQRRSDSLEAVIARQMAGEPARLDSVRVRVRANEFLRRNGTVSSPPLLPPPPPPPSEPWWRW